MNRRTRLSIVVLPLDLELLVHQSWSGTVSEGGRSFGLARETWVQIPDHGLLITDHESRALPFGLLVHRSWSEAVSEGGWTLD